MAECIQLEDSTYGSRARILTGFGFNCFEFQVRGPNGPLDVLWSVDNFESGQERASSSGIPLLFPFPGRIPGEEFLWEGKSYPLAAGDGRGNAIHGFVLNRPWRVLEQTSTKVRGEFQCSRDAPEVLKCWPADFQLTVTYELHGNSLRCEITATNPDERPLPCGLGTHPYFRLPLGGPSADDCQVQLPVQAEWELAEMLPTGARVPLETAAAYAEGRAFQELTLDNVFSGLRFDGRRCTTSLRDTASGLRVDQRFTDAFRELVVYTPPHREAICIEPYTCVPGAQQLQADQGLDTGFRVLAPGESFTAEIEIEVSAELKVTG